MKKSVIGGVAAIVVIGGIVTVNSIMNNKAQDAVNEFIANANQESQLGKFSADGVECSVLFSDHCVFNGFKFENVQNPQQSFKATKLTVSGIKSFIGSKPSDKTLLPVGDTQVGLKAEGLSSLDGQKLSDIIATESPKFYSALTDDIKTALENNDFYIQANANNQVTTDNFTSDDKVSLHFNHLPLQLSTQIKYTYTGDQSVLRDPKAAVHNKGNIFAVLGNLIINKVSVSVEQGKYMFSDVFYGFYSNYIEKCTDKERCIQRGNSPFPEPFKSQETALTKAEFEAALVKTVDSKQGALYQQIERFSYRTLFTPEEFHQIADFIIKGDKTMIIDLVNKKNVPVLGFADVIGQGSSALRERVSVEIK